MEKETSQKIKLGIFVTAGVIVMIFGLYLIGKNQNFFGRSFKIVAVFSNVNGLLVGNNVRFAGTDVGSISSVEIINDTSVNVILKIDEKYHPFIKKNVVASVGTDGLMGNKLVNLTSPFRMISAVIEINDTIETITPLETDEMLRTLNRTNEYVSTIALNLKNLTDQIGSSRGTLWKLLTDQKLSLHLDTIMGNIDQSSKRIFSLSDNLNKIVSTISHGNGMIGTILNDTMFYSNLQKTMQELKVTTERTSKASSDLNNLINQVENGKGTLGVLIKDSMMSNDLKQSIYNIKLGTNNFNQTMEALKHSSLLKGYFKKAEKEKNELNKKQ